jgi:hypothetical protein
VTTEASVASGTDAARNAENRDRANEKALMVEKVQPVASRQRHHSLMA